MNMRRLLRAAQLGLVLLLIVAAAALAVFLWREDVTALTPADVRRQVDEINEAAGVTVPHGFDDGAVRQTALPLFLRVERDQPLTDADSRSYRVLYQGIILSRQATLRRFDRNLTVLTDVDMDRPNNVGGNGIAGSHDHHDVSVRSNLADLTAEVATVQHSGFTPTRVRNAILAYKDLSDTLAHLATVSHTKSTPYRPRVGPASEIESLGEESLREFKTVQFAAVNSPEYWRAMFRALDRFDALALRVQHDLDASLTPVERKLAGRWGSPQSLGPWLAKGTTARRYRSTSD